MHAEQYPAIWFGIWGGPDGINGVQSSQPGGTWVSALTPMTDFPVMNASAGGGRIVYEQAGVLHLLDPASGKSERLKIGVASD